MELTDILSVEAWGAFEKELFDRFQINCTVYNTDGVGVTGKPNWCNTLCPEIKANKESLAAICAPGNQHFMAETQRTGKAVIDECDAGLLKIAVPIFKDGEFLGTAGGCGRLPEGGEVDTFMVHKATGMTEEEVAGFCQGIAAMSEAEAGEMARFIEERLSQYLAKAS
jgi:ligand-binding sensor protein